MCLNPAVHIPTPLAVEAELFISASGLAFVNAREAPLVTSSKRLQARFLEEHPFCEFAKFVRYDVADGARKFAQTGFDYPREITCPQVIALAFEIGHSKS